METGKFLISENLHAGIDAMARCGEKNAARKKGASMYISVCICWDMHMCICGCVGVWVFVEWVSGVERVSGRVGEGERVNG